MVDSAIARAFAAPSASAARTSSGFRLELLSPCSQRHELPVEVLEHHLLALDAAPPGSRAARVNVAHGVVGADRLVHREDVADLRAPGVAQAQALRVRERTAQLLPEDLRPVEQGDSFALRLAHLGHAVEAHDARRRGPARHGFAKDRSEAVVEAPRHLLRELEELELVVPDLHDCGAVDEDVGAHPHRVGEERRRHELLVLALLLELLDRRQVVHRRHRREVPGQLGVLADIALDEERGLPRVKTAGDEVGREPEDMCPEVPWRVRRGDGVRIDDAEEGLLLLALNLPHPRADGPEVVADVQLAGRRDGRHDAGALRRAGARGAGRVRHRDPPSSTAATRGSRGCLRAPPFGGHPVRAADA